MKKINLILTLMLLSLVGCKSSDKQQDLVWVESNCDSLPKIEFDLKEINRGMEERAKDSIWSKYWKSEYERQIDILKKVPNNKFVLYPYQEVDSALFYFYEPASKEDENLDLDKRQVKDVSQLCNKKTKLLLNVINNPLNFGIGECGTDIPFSKIVLFNKGQEIGNLIFGCSYSMISTYPSNPMITGGLTEHGDSLLTLIKIWE